MLTACVEPSVLTQPTCSLHTAEPRDTGGVRPRDRRPASSGRSLQQYLRGELIRLAEQPDNDAILECARERVRVTGKGLTSDQILDFLDAGRSERDPG